MLAKVIRFRERLVGVLHILSSRRFDCFISTFTENLWNYRHSSNFDALNDIFDVLWMSDFGTRIKLELFFMDQQSKAFVLTDKPRRHVLGQPCRNWRHIVARETIMADTLYCICRQTYDPSQFMIQCDSCEEWFHGRLAFIVPRFRVTLKGEKKLPNHFV